MDSKMDKNKIICLYCGEANNNDNITCKKCGNQLHLRNKEGNIINTSSNFANDVEIIINILPEYSKKLAYVPDNNPRKNNLIELFQQGNKRAIFEDIWLFYRIVFKDKNIKYEDIVDKNYQSLDETVVFYSTVMAKRILDYRTNNDNNLCNKKNYEIVAYILGFSHWFERVNNIEDDSSYDNYNSSLSDSEIEYLNARINIKIEKIKNQTDKVDLNNKTKRPSIITILFCLFIFGLGVFLYSNIFNRINVNECKKSAVKIYAFDSNSNIIKTGSGFCAIQSNYIITNYHVIEGASTIRVSSDSNSLYIVTTVKRQSAKNDLAILIINGKLKPLKLGNPSKCQIGDDVVAIGCPKGEQNIVSKGNISGFNEEKNIISITTPISHGSSGGALLDKYGRVIGITTAGYDDAQNLNYAISVDILKSML